jgi:hypothetical protein
MIHLCIPVLKRYDLLRNLLLSLEHSTVQPHTVHVIDNGRDRERLITALCILPKTVKTDVFIPDAPMGLAEAWNWFIENVPEERIITNDDVLFASDSLQRIIETAGDFVSPLPGQAYSCFLLRDSCVKKIGAFDEEISPGYAYFEDCDYSERMVEAGFCITHVEAGVTHLGSQTLAAKSGTEVDEHNRRFLVAQGNFIAKWGRMPPGKVQQV